MLRKGLDKETFHALLVKAIELASKVGNMDISFPSIYQILNTWALGLP